MTVAEPIEELTAEVAKLREELANHQETPCLMNTSECAEFLGVGKDILFEWRKRGEGPPFLHMTTRTIRYDRSDVLEWARSHRVK